MPDLYGVIKARTSGPLYDTVFVDVMQKGAGASEDDVAQLLNHRIRVPRFALESEILSLVAAEMTRLELATIPAPTAGQVSAVPLSVRLRFARPDRKLIVVLIEILRRLGRV